MEYLYEVAKNGTSINKVKIAKECPKTYFLDSVVDKKVYKIEGNDELAGYNTYCWFFKDEEIAKKWLSSIKNRDFSCKCETKILPNATQKAIECLEDVKKWCEQNYDEMTDEEIDTKIKVIGLNKPLYLADMPLYDCIDQKISELKGE